MLNVACNDNILTFLEVLSVREQNLEDSGDIYIPLIRTRIAFCGDSILYVIIVTIMVATSSELTNYAIKCVNLLVIIIL